MNFYETTERFGIPIVKTDPWDGNKAILTEIMQRIMDLEVQVERLQDEVRKL